MVEAGILQEYLRSPDNSETQRFAVAELYLYGLGMTRQGQRQARPRRATRSRSIDTLAPLYYNKHEEVYSGHYLLLLFVASNVFWKRLQVGTTIPIFIMVGLAILFGILVMVITTFIGPKKPTPEKLAPYECGIQEIEAPRRRFPIKYLRVGMLFIAFDIEIVSFYPLAVLLHQLKVFGLIELLVFLLVLAIGYIYVWRKGAFTWE
jgi:NADH-quinone oxidoreductase subunit A